MVRGNLNKQIAHELGSTERTIKAHRQRVTEKMQVQSLAQLVSIAERRPHTFSIGLGGIVREDNTE